MCNAENLDLLKKQFKNLEGYDYDNLSKALDVFEVQLFFPAKVLSKQEERNELSVYISWFFCRLLEIAIDKKTERYVKDPVFLNVHIFQTLFSAFKTKSLHFRMKSLSMLTINNDGVIVNS